MSATPDLSSYFLLSFLLGFLYILFMSCHFSRVSSSCPLPFFSIPLSCPCHFLGMSASYSMCVPFFHCQSFPYISLPVLWFPCPLFAPHPFSSPPSFPFHFHVLSCHVKSPSPARPCISLYVLLSFAFARYYPDKKHGFAHIFVKRDVKITEFFKIFGKRRQKTIFSGTPSAGPLRTQTSG